MNAPRRACSPRYAPRLRWAPTTSLAVMLLASTSLHTTASPVEVSSLSELMTCAEQSHRTVSMKPGVYRLIDTIPLESIPERRRQKRFQWVNFSGSNNEFNLQGVIIEVDTALREALRPPMHNSEFVVSGDHNTLRGLTITNIGSGTSLGGAVLSILGAGTTLIDCSITVRGSYPYGYGDLFGKGGGSIIHHRKQSGIHIAGDGTRLFGCHLTLRSFGHGYYLQNDAANVHLEGCSVEGEMRSTDALLAETSGPAFDVGFRTVMRNRTGENRVMRGYMKSLAEDGFRTYGQHTNLTFKNCTARNMRGGFELRSKTGVRLENCLAIGNERGFWISSDATLTECRGDAQYGPLLFLEGDHATVHLQLLPTESDAIIHAVGTIHGAGHQVTLVSEKNSIRTHPLPLLLGYAPPGAGEGMSPFGERPTLEVSLRNETSMPVVVGPQASHCTIVTRGPVIQNAGRAIAVIREGEDPPPGKAP